MKGVVPGGERNHQPDDHSDQDDGTEDHHRVAPPEVVVIGHYFLEWCPPPLLPVPPCQDPDPGPCSEWLLVPSLSRVPGL